MRHELTAGDVVMFAAYIDRLYSPIDSLNGIAVGLQQNVTSLQRAIRTAGDRHAGATWRGIARRAGEGGIP